MAVRSIPVLLATAGLVTSVSALAVGLGEIRLQSTINQPLAAEIELLSVEGREAGQLRARLGSPEDFARAGLERSYALTGLAFRPVLDAPGGPVLKVTSPQSIREPFLDFLVRLEWPDGQLLRAYTLLLDLPEQPVQPPLARRDGPATFDTSASASRQPQQRSLGVAPLRRPAITPGSDTYTVRSGDTLWSVARRARPQGATVQQTLMAIYRENPDAFIDGDMNRMRRGHALRVPEASEVAAVDADDARATVWRETGAGLSTALLPVATIASSSGSDTGATSGQLRLAAPRLETPSGGAVTSSQPGESVGESSTAASVQGVGQEMGSGSPQGSSELLSDSEDTAVASGTALSASAAEKILYLEEEVQLTRRENRELHERIDNLEEQLSVMSRLVELQSDSVAATRLSEPALSADAAADPVAALAEAEEASAETSAGTASDEPVAEERTAEARVAEPSLFSKAWLTLGGLAVVLLGGMVVVRRRHQSADEPEGPALFMSYAESHAESHADSDSTLSEPEGAGDALAEAESGQSDLVAAEPDETENASLWTTAGDDDTAGDAVDPLATFAVAEPSPDSAFTACVAEEREPYTGVRADGSAEERAASDEAGAEAGIETPVETKTALEAAAETELEFDLGLDLDSDLSRDLDSGIDPEIDLELDLSGDLGADWSDLTPSSPDADGETADDSLATSPEAALDVSAAWEEMPKDIVANDFDGLGTDPHTHPAANLGADLDADIGATAPDETSLEKWFAELAGEPATGQNNGAGVAAAAAEASDRSNGTVVLSSNDDYRVATTFDLDFSAFSAEDEALTQRDPSQTRLELARVYIDMQDSQSAREILEELAEAANEDVQRDARELLHSLG